jgi:peroxiredoxin-like protein
VKDLPHRYGVNVVAAPEGAVSATSEGLPELSTAPPPEFDGPGGAWSPETLLVAAAADCFALTFRAIARASKLDWVGLSCDVEGELDRVDRVMRFTKLTTSARLEVPSGTDEAKARRLLERAEQTCLVTNSLNVERHLEIEIEARA